MVSRFPALKEGSSTENHRKPKEAGADQLLISRPYSTQPDGVLSRQAGVCLQRQGEEG